MGSMCWRRFRESDKADEVVMLGAHFDSWHAGSGATDNAAGSAVMMEAMRIAEGDRPEIAANGSRRTVGRRGTGTTGFESVREAIISATPKRCS